MSIDTPVATRDMRVAAATPRILPHPLGDGVLRDAVPGAFVTREGLREPPVWTGALYVVHVTMNSSCRKLSVVAMSSTYG